MNNCGTFHVEVCKLSGDILGTVSLTGKTAASDAVRKICKKAGVSFGPSHVPLVVLGSGILPDDPGACLCDYVPADSSDLVAIVVCTDVLQVRVVKPGGEVVQALTMPATSTVKDVALKLQEHEGIHLTRQRLEINEEEVPPPNQVLASFKHQQLTFTLVVLPEVSTLRINLDGDPGTESQFVVDGQTTNNHGFAYNVRVGSYMMLNGCPCRVTEVRPFLGGGKRGYPKVHLVGRDIFSARVVENIFRAGDTFDVPVVSHREYQLLSLDLASGHLSLLEKDGSVKDDVDMPTVTSRKLGHQHPVDRDLERRMEASLEAGELVTVTVRSALGTEKIVEMCSHGP